MTMKMATIGTPMTKPKVRPADTQTHIIPCRRPSEPAEVQRRGVVCGSAVGGMGGAGG